MNDPLLNNQVDMISQVDPFATVLMDTGKVDSIAYTNVEAQPGANLTQYVAMSKWVEANSDLAHRFARAIVKGATFANDPANEAETRQINVDFTRLNPALKDRLMLPLFGIEPDLSQIKRTEALMLKYKMLASPVELSGRILPLR